MIDINVLIKDNKRVKVSNNVVGNKFDNLITRLNFCYDECTFDERLIYKYLAIKNENITDYELIDISNKNSIILDNTFTRNFGRFDCLIILSETELTEYISSNDDNFVSDIFNLYINNNFMEDINNLEIKTNKEGK